MTLLIMPTYSCHLACAYCFESAIGYRMKVKLDYDIDAITSTVEEIIKHVRHDEAVLHGGEPLLLPLDDLEILIARLRTLGLRVSIQSSCSIISDLHIDLFKRYDVSIGCSADGPGELNMLRGFWFNGRYDKELSDRYNRVLQENLEKLANEKLLKGVLTIVSRANAGSVEKLEKLAKWILWLRDLGVNSGRLNPMYATTPWSKPYEMSVDELYKAYIWLWENLFSRNDGLYWSPYQEIVALLLGNEDRGICWFGGCGFYDSFVWTVGPRGELLSCDRTLGSGLWSRALPWPETPLLRKHIRAIALCKTELRGSKYCHLHKGGCPAESPNGDWRRASRFWRLWEKLFEYFEHVLKRMAPWLRLASEVPDKITYIEKVSSGCRWNPFAGEYDCPRG